MQISEGAEPLLKRIADRTQVDPKPMTVVVIAGTGVYDDVRVRKCAESLSKMDSVHRIPILGVNRKGKVPTEARWTMPRKCSVVLFGASTSPWSISRSAWVATKAVFLLKAVVMMIRETRSGDLVYCHDLDTALVGLIGKVAKRKFVLDLHEVYPHRHGLGRLVRSCLSVLESIALRFSDIHVSVSEDAEAYFSSRVSFRPGFVVTNSRPSSEISGESRNIQRLRTTPIRIVYLGGLMKGRGLHALMDSVLRLPDGFVLDVIGFGPLRAELGELANVINARLHNERIRLLDPVALDQVVHVMSDYDIGCVLTEQTCLNHDLTLSNKLFDYAAVGLPQILSSVQSHRSIMERYNIGRISHVDGTSIAAAVTSLTNSSASYRLAHQEAHRLAVERSWEREWAPFASALERVSGWTSSG